MALFTCGEAHRSMDPNWPFAVVPIISRKPVQRSIGTWVSEFNFEVRLDLQDHLEVTMASEATKMAVRGNIHMNTRVLVVACFKSEVKFDL